MSGESSSTTRRSSSNNLDLSGIEDPQQLASEIEAFYTSDSAVKSQLSWHWEKNHLYLDGKQWLVYEGTRETGGLWKPLRVSTANEYIPRPVTNYIFDAYQTLKGYILKNKPRISVRPNTQAYQDKEAAKLATLVAETNYERLKEEANYEYAASCGITYGTVFKKSYWDNSAVGGQVKVPRTQMQPKTDPQTGQVIGEEEVPAIDPETGDQMFDIMPLGDVNTEVVEPYRIATDPLANDIHYMRWIMEYSIQPLSWIREMYSRDEEGYTGRIDDVKEEQQLSNSMRRFYQLKTSSGAKGTSYQSLNAVTPSDYMIENAAVVKEYYERPTQEHPKGRMIVVANGIPLYVGESPYEGPELGDWHPYSEYRWEVVPGRFWGKSPLDDATDIQKIINSIDATIILTRKTMAIPQKLIPLGIGVEPGRWTGRPGQEIFYRNDGSGSIPSTVPAAGVDQTVFLEREKRLEDFKQITGAVDILKGDRPPGVTAASALNMLYEVGTGKLFPTLDRWKKFIESDQKKQLKLIAQKYREPREAFIKMLKMKNKDLSEQDIAHFIGTDLYDNCNVTIEAGSNIPKLQSAEQAMLMEVAQTGALALEQPANRAEFLERLGLSGFDSDYGPDSKRASWENDLMDNILMSPDNRPIVLDADNHAIHIQIHEDRMKQPSFMSLPSEVQQLYMQHNQQHEQMEQMEQQSLMLQSQQAAMTGAPPPQPEAGQGMPHESNLQPAGKGISKQLQNSLHQDALPPGNVGARKQ